MKKNYYGTLSLISLIFLLVAIVGCEDYNQVVITPAVVVDTQMSDDNQTLTITITEEDKQENEVIEIMIPDEEDNAEEELDERQNNVILSEEENIRRERDALSLIDLSTITINNCELQDDLWERAIDRVQEDLDEEEDDFEQEQEDLKAANEYYESVRGTGSENQIKVAKDRLEEAEDDFNDQEDDLEELQDIFFRTQYTQNQINRICKQLQAISSAS